MSANRSVYFGEPAAGMRKDVCRRTLQEQAINGFFYGLILSKVSGAVGGSCGDEKFDKEKVGVSLSVMEIVWYGFRS